MVRIWALNEYCAVIRGEKMVMILYPKKNVHNNVLITKRPQLKNCNYSQILEIPHNM